MIAKGQDPLSSIKPAGFMVNSTSCTKCITPVIVKYLQNNHETDQNCIIIVVLVYLRHQHSIPPAQGVPDCRLLIHR